MSSFAALMALSATQTRQAEAAVQTALAQRQKKEAERRKAQDERERKEKELETKLRMKKFEEEKRERERQARIQQEREAKERELKRREEEERDRLRYGPKKGSGRTDSNGYPVSSAVARKSRVSDSDDESGANALTREEKRQRRLEAEFRHGLGSGKRSARSSGYSKTGRQLPGGAVDITTTGSSHGDSGSSMSVRQRLAAEPAMLIKLNVNKRDTRTIDEILQDRAKAKAAQVLQGDQAKEFNDWFGKGKTAAKTLTPQPNQTTAGSATQSASTSRANTPVASSQPSRRLSGTASPASRTQSSAPKTSASSTISKPFPDSRPSVSKPTPAKFASAKSQPPVSRASSSAKPAVPANKSAVKKRPRSPSLSRSPSPLPPPRKRPSVQNDISSEIWKLFGKDRSRYVGADVYSDDEDMEVGARDLEREELRSARIARREEEIAQEEERRHEEEKRRRRKEKEMREWRG